MKPAGFENGQGVVTAQYLMDPTDKQWDNHADMKAWVAWMGKYNPRGHPDRTRPMCSPMPSRC